MSIYQVFDRKEDTGIPAVRQYVQNIAEQKEKEATKRLIKTLDLLIKEIKDYLTENEITVSVGEGLNSKDFYLQQHAHRFFHLGVHVPLYLHFWGYIQIFGGAISNSSFGGTKKFNCIFSTQGRAPCCFL